MVVNMNTSGKGGTLVDTVKLPGIYTHWITPASL